MAIVLVEKLDKIDQRKTAKKINIINSFDESKDMNNEDFDYVLEATEENVRKATSHAEHVYIPSTILNSNHQVNQYVYFDLESYPFFQKVKKLIDSQKQSKGVLRFRRMMLEENRSLIASDLYVLSSIFGDAGSVHVKQSKQIAGAFHMILLVNFGKGIMSHIDYTVANEERIELELSGIKSIIEFNSDHMKPIRPESKTTLPLSYTVDEIITSARKVDEKLLHRLQDIRALIEGGVPV